MLDSVRPDHTALVYSNHEMMVADFTRKPDYSLPGMRLRQAIEDRVGKGPLKGLDANRLAVKLFGDSIASNMIMLGLAVQLGYVPVSPQSIETAIELNGAAVAMNKQAFRVGRLAAHDPAAIDKLMADSAEAKPSAPPSLADLIARRASHLVGYQDEALAERYRTRIDAIARLESDKTPGRTGLAEAAAKGYFKLLSYKDEYEVARLYTDGRFEQAVKDNFDGELKFEFHLAPPMMAWWNRDKVTGHPRKMSFGRWMLPVFRVLAKGKTIRGTAWDIFGRTAERRLERQMIADYETVLDEIERRLSPATHATAVQLAQLPEDIKGFGHVKLANYETAKKREANLLAMLRDPKPAAPALKAAE